MDIRKRSLEVVWSSVLIIALNVISKESACIAALDFMSVVVFVNHAPALAPHALHLQNVQDAFRVIT
jgi:hypothetical protein